MRTHMIQQYKKIKNSPMRSPSPDYSCRNRSKNSTTPLQQSKIIYNTIQSLRAVQFPKVPLQILDKKKDSNIENRKPDRGSKQKQWTTANSKNQKNDQNIPHISDFIQNAQKVKPQELPLLQIAFKLVQEIHLNLFPNYVDFMNKSQQKSNNKIKSMIDKLKNIENQVKYLIGQSERTKNQRKDESCLLVKNYVDTTSNNKGQIQRKQLFANSPIKNKQHLEQDSFSMIQINELLSENTKLKKQLKSLKIQIEGSNQKNDNHFREVEVNDWQASPKQRKKQKQDLKNGVIWQGGENDSSFSSTTFQFLKQKISFLEHQLQNQLQKMSKMQEIKNQQITLLRKRIVQISQQNRSQIEKYKKILQLQQKNVVPIQESRVLSSKILPSKRSRINSETIKTLVDIQENEIPQKLKIDEKKKALSWDKEEVVSICDNEQHNQMSQFSQAERVDINNMFSTRRVTSQKKEQQKAHYQQIITNNTIKYHQQLQILQQQLVELKMYLEKQDLESESEHKKCSKCKNSNESEERNVLDQNIYILDLQKEIAILKNSVEEQKKQNGKLRDIINMTIQEGNKKVQKKNKGKKLQKIEKKSVKSEDLSESNNSSIIDSNINFSLQNIGQEKYISQSNQ